MFNLMILWLSLLFCQLTLVNTVTLPSPVNGQREVTKKRCETVSVAFCREIGYNETIFPNLLNHNSQQNAGLALHRITPLIKVNCSPDLKLLLCAVFFPPCTILEAPIPPCRSICLSSKNGCEDVIHRFGQEWPSYLDCDKFPDVEPCVSRTGSRIASESSLTPTSASTGVNYAPTAPFRFVCPVHFMVPKGEGYILRLNGRIYHDCATPCDGLLFNSSDRKLIRAEIIILAIICLVSSLFTLFTHLLESRRFSYPEKILKFLAISYTAIALIHIIGFVFGDRISCNEPPPVSVSNPDALMIKTITQGNSKSVCSLTFMALYIFSHSSFIWFTIMTFTWFIAFCFGWGREAFERISIWFHVFAWGIPSLDAIRILAMKRIEGDPLSGVCYHNFWNREDYQHYTDSFLYFVYISLSILFLAIGFYFSFRLRRELRDDARDTYKMDTLLWRVSIFSVFYLVSSFISIACNVYEVSHLDSWMLDWQQTVCLRPELGIPCPFQALEEVPKKPNLHYFVLKYAARLVPGISLSFHLFSRKTLDSWLDFNRKLWNTLCCINEPMDQDKSIDE
ncbi:frizzled-like [Tetranychus urticae]|nr:frizzled-like [Tetranychus urticae]